MVTSAVLLYGSYWAFVIRRARTSGPHRRQALSVGVVGVYFAVLWLISPFTDPLVTGLPVTFATGAFSFFFGFVLIFVWIDTSMRVARRSDPLHRDTFHWKLVRVFLIVFIGLDTVALTGIGVRMFFVAGEAISALENIGFLALILAIILLGAPALLVAAVRSRDPTLRRNLKWFSVFVALVLTYAEVGYIGYVLDLPGSLGSGSAALTFELISILFLFLPVIAAYSLFRSARSLAPVRHIDRAGVTDVGVPAATA